MKKVLAILFLVLSASYHMRADDKLRIAVFETATYGVAMDDGIRLAVQELISNVFVNTGRYIMVERSMIDKILREQSFNNSDLADNAQATEIGKLAGANKVVLSAASSAGGRNMLSIKLIDVETATVERQRAVVVAGGDELLDAVESLTVDLIGENLTGQTLKKSGQTSPKGDRGEAIGSNIDAEITAIQSRMQTLFKSDKKTIKMLEKLPQVATGFDISIRGQINCSYKDGVLAFSGQGRMQPEDAAAWKAMVPQNLVKCIVVEDGITSVSGFAGCSDITHVKLGPSVESIDNECFARCRNLVSLEFPQRLKRVGAKAFFWCSRLPSLFLPDSIEDIGTEAFSRCGKLASITLPESLKRISDGTFSRCERLTEIIIPQNVASIGKEAFFGCKDMVELYIPDNVQSIGECAFQQMRSLSSVRLSESLRYIPCKAFDSCVSLFKIEIPQSVENVGDEAFADCDNLSTIIFYASSLTYLGEGAFKDDGNLNDVTFYSLTPPSASGNPWGDKNANKRVVLKVPSQVINIYQSNKYWKGFSVTGIVGF